MSTEQSPSLSVEEKGEVARFGIHDEEPRWKVACINWTWPTAPHAISYLLIDGSAHVERFHDTWEDAIAWLESFGDKLTEWADYLAKINAEQDHG